MSTDSRPQTRDLDRQTERLCRDLQDQMRMARDRISDRYAKLMEDRAQDPARGDPAR